MILWPCLEVGATGIEIAYLMHVSANKMGLHKWVSPVLLVFVWASITTIVTMFNYLTDNSVISIFLYPLLFSVYYYVFLEGTIKAGIFWFLFLLTNLCCFSALSITFLTSLFDVHLFTYAIQDSLRLLLLIMDKFMLILFWVLILRIPNIEYSKIKTSYLLIPILVIAILCVMMLAPDMLGIDQHLFFILVIFLLFIVNASYYIMHKTNKKENNIILAKSLQSQQRPYNINATQKWNHFLCISKTCAKKSMSIYKLSGFWPGMLL